ncbi:unnamed protein product [Linum trigynum]|uniref:Uncharacterized protein n=1 Tax=Linum trigynum TaxID=586398 RepID=A0AAV2E5R6_9ROSI
MPAPGSSIEKESRADQSGTREQDGATTLNGMACGNLTFNDNDGGVVMPMRKVEKRHGRREKEWADWVRLVPRPLLGVKRNKMEASQVGYLGQMGPYMSGNEQAQ